jgi:hypothetical protein
MKVAELVAYLKTLPQETEVLIADYYYDYLEGYEPISIEDFKEHARLTSETDRYQSLSPSLLINTRNAV